MPRDEFDRKHRAQQQRIALASIRASDPLWQTILEICDEHERNMLDRAIEENLTDAGRHYNAGLAAGAQYLANAFRDLKAQADAESRKRKQEE